MTAARFLLGSLWLRWRASPGTPGWPARMGEGFQRLKAADAEIAYRWEPAELKVGQFFAAEVVACRAPAAGRARSPSTPPCRRTATA